MYGCLCVKGPRDDLTDNNQPTPVLERTVRRRVAALQALFLNSGTQLYVQGQISI